MNARRGAHKVDCTRVQRAFQEHDMQDVDLTTTQMLKLNTCGGHDSNRRPKILMHEGSSGYLPGE